MVNGMFNKVCDECGNSATITRLDATMVKHYFCDQHYIEHCNLFGTKKGTYKMYKYSEIKEDLLTDEGQRSFLKIRDTIKDVLRKAGAIKSGNMLKLISGDSWFVLACLDRLVEIGEIVEITPESAPGQDRVFVEP